MVGPSAPATKRRLPSFCSALRRRAAGKPRAVAVQFIDHLLHAVVGLGDRGGGKGVGLEDIGARHGVGVVDLFDGAAAASGQEVVVALQMTGAVGEAVAAKMIFAEAKLLDLRAHRAIHDQDAFARRAFNAAMTSDPSGRGETGPKRASMADMGNLPF